MHELKQYLKNHKYFLIILSLLICISLLGYFLYQKFHEYNAINESKVELLAQEKSDQVLESQNELETIYVDIKGAINNPGVYQATKNNIVNDIIAMAGGLKENASTANINLSHKLEDEMVIVIYTKNQIDDKKVEDKQCSVASTDITSCLKDNNSLILASNNAKNSSENSSQSPSTSEPDNSSTLISLNTATEEELMSLPGIGQAKAMSIISYREENGQFTKIEDITNVSGIGQAVFEKIKSYITV